MKLDREQVLCEGNANHTLDAKSFENDNSGFTTGNGTAHGKQDDNSYELKVGESEANLFSNSMEEENNLTASKHDKYEETEDFVPSEHIDHLAPEMESFMEDENNWNTSKYDKDGEFKDRLPLEHFNHLAPEMQAFTDQVELCLEKSEMQHDVPKEVVCCNETTYVKDICVDEGLLSQDKHLVDSKVSEKRACSSIYPSDDIEIKMVDEKFDVVVPTAEVLSRSADGRKEDHFTNQDSSADSLPKDVGNNSFLDWNSKSPMTVGEIEGHRTEKPEIKPLEKIFSLGELLSMSRLDICYAKPYRTNIEDSDQETLQSPFENELSKKASGGEEKISFIPLSSVTTELDYDHEQPILDFQSQESKAKESSHIPDGVSASTPIFMACKSDNGLEETVLGISNHGEGKPASHALDSTSGISSNMSTSELLNNSKARTTCVTSSFDPSTSNAIMRNNDLQNGNAEGFKAKTATRREDADMGQLPNANIGESSFSAAGPISGLITYSGPIAYSGSVSLRSESSTTSTHSFAFPILQSEWNSSPVRMAKADKRQLRKYRRWSQGILCCKF